MEGDGVCRMWCSVSKASGLPSPVGGCAGRIDGAQGEALGGAGKRTAGEGSRTWLVSPDSPVDTIDVDGVSAKLGIHHPGEGAWQEFLALARPLLRELTSSPVAAIALEVNGGARLVHQGTEPITLGLASLTVRVDHCRHGQ